MNRLLLTAATAASLLLPLALTGCGDREVASTTKTKIDDDGDVTRQTKTVVEDAEGDRKVIEKKETTKIVDDHDHD